MGSFSRPPGTQICYLQMVAVAAAAMASLVQAAPGLVATGLSHSPG